MKLSQLKDSLNTYMTFGQANRTYHLGTIKHGSLPKISYLDLKRTAVYKRQGVGPIINPATDGVLSPAPSL